MTASALLSDIRLGQITLIIRDRDIMLRFYTECLGMDLLRSSGETHVLGFGAIHPVLELIEDNTAMTRPSNAPGLFHAAYLYPDRKKLASALRRLASCGWPLHGAADHGVSEALYLADPEGNGIELYVDRPKEEWPFRNGQLEMVTEQLDMDGLLSEKEGEGAARSGVRIGHIHLQVSSLREAEAFWCGTIGLAPTQRSFPGALFASAGGYHHHVGINTWRSKGVSLPNGHWTGLRSIAIAIPDKRDYQQLRERLLDDDNDEISGMSTQFESTHISIRT